MCTGQTTRKSQKFDVERWWRWLGVFTCSWSSPTDSTMLLRMRRMLLMHRVLNKELNKDVIDLQRNMQQENYQNISSTPPSWDWWWSYFADRQKMLRMLPAKPTVPKISINTPTIQNLKGDKWLFVKTFQWNLQSTLTNLQMADPLVR